MAPEPSLASLLLPFILSLVLATSVQSSREGFIHCFDLHSKNDTTLSHILYGPENPSFASVFDLLVQELRFATPTTPRPQVIVTPLDETHIRSAIHCAKKHGLEIRIRSGGHDFEGASYKSEEPFVILDLFNLNSITVDVENATAWVQSGATLGKLYYEISKKSRTLAFPAGYWSTVGVGGHLGGGGYGPLLRKYGLAGDNVIDAKFIDVNGKILDRKSMGEDLFWALKGAGGGNFGVIVAFKIKLVAVPENVTVFKVSRTLEQNATKLVHKWQYVAPSIHEDLTMALRIKNVKSSQAGKQTISVGFESLFLGGADRLLSLMQEKFSELGLVREDCSEMSWIQSVVVLAGIFPAGAPPEVLLNKTAAPKQYTKQKADYVEKPISVEGIEGLWKVFFKIDPESGGMNWTPYGGRMSETSESETPYPHRARNIFMIYEAVYWKKKDGAVSQRHIDWVRKLYKYMTPFVAKNPRSSYFNYRDYDLGVNSKGKTSYEEASVWGVKYFKDNFKRLAKVKAKVDPDDFFRSEQTVPPLFGECGTSLGK
ncbi:hypothetical protein RJ639_027236 [Escallonia herrerae]|uniref:FAD-binding PCMH-type domain-containing protein n=1 Tax=Escallonia herrerae TaxID=1293975 RepID=A0AA89BEX2_9ASTE|nr:hypothetical protein RJ639_027236 [Escallonia herrerae]